MNHFSMLLFPIILMGTLGTWLSKNFEVIEKFKVVASKMDSGCLRIIMETGISTDMLTETGWLILVFGLTLGWILKTIF